MSNYSQYDDNYQYQSNTSVTSNTENNTNFEYKNFIESINGSKIYKIQVNVADFKAENIKIQLNDLNMLIISGFCETDTILPQTMKKSKQFKREIKLPDYIDIHKMRSYLIPDYNNSSVLTIEAPIRTLTQKSNLSEKFIMFNENSNTNTSNPVVSNIATNNNNTTTNNNNTTTYSALNRNSQINSATTTSANPTPRTPRTPRSVYSSTYERLNANPFANSLESNEISSGILKYKFSLKEYKPQDISICVKDGKKLLINAVNESHDHYGKMCREFVREINLPQNIDPYKIKNCYDPIEGILRIEIPLSISIDDIISNELKNKSIIYRTNSTSNANEQEKMNVNENHLELTFDLANYQLSNINVVSNQNKSKILRITAISTTNDNNNNNNNSHENEKQLQYLLPNWVDTTNYKVYKKLVNSPNNFIVVKLPILKEYLPNSNNIETYTNNNNNIFSNPIKGPI